MGAMKLRRCIRQNGCDEAQKVHEEKMGAIWLRRRLRQRRVCCLPVHARVRVAAQVWVQIQGCS